MALDGRRTRGTRNISDEELPRALEALRDLGIYSGLDEEKGYGPGQKLNMGRRMYVRKLIAEARTLFDLERSPSTGAINFVPSKAIAFYTPTDDIQNKNAREALGLNNKAWKTFPVPVIPGYKGKTVKIQASSNKKDIGLVIDYPDWALRHTIVPFDSREIFKGMRIDKDEESQKDEMVERFKEWARKTLSQFDDGKSWFRLTTKHGDVSSTKYATSIGVDVLIDDLLPKILNKYYTIGETAEGDLYVDQPDILTGISVYRRTKPPKRIRTEQLKKIQTAEFNRPKKKRVRRKSKGKKHPRTFK